MLNLPYSYCLYGLEKPIQTISRLLSFIFIGENVSENCMHIPYITHNNLNIASHLNIESHLNIASHLQRPTNRSKITLANNEICNV